MEWGLVTYSLGVEIQILHMVSIDTLVRAQPSYQLAGVKGPAPYLGHPVRVQI